MTLQPINKKTIAIIVLSVAVAVLVLAAFGTAYVYAYSGKVYPRVNVGSFPVSGLTVEEARTLLNAHADRMLEAGLTVAVSERTETIPLRYVSLSDPDLSKDLAILYIDEAVNEAFSVGRTGSITDRAFALLRVSTGSVQIPIHLELDEATIEQELATRFESFYDPAIEPSFAFSRDEETGWSVETVPGSSGRSFDMKRAIAQTAQKLSSLQAANIVLEIVDQSPNVSDEEARALHTEALGILEFAPYELVYDGGIFDRYAYTLTDDRLAKMLMPMRVVNEADNWTGTQVGVNEAFDAFLAEIAEDINIEPKNARFAVSGPRVTEFAPSHEGREVNVKLLRERMVSELRSRPPMCLFPTPDGGTPDCENFDAIEIPVQTSEPSIATGEVNDLGITEILGVGTSNFKGSPANRIKNIRHGVDKLNGILIAPDEEFSLLAALRPFTIEDGYLPELVIKGDEIKPEVAGGLCQIGSTTFRAVMNSGLPVTARRNHSLVVSYYNDPSNGNPGTDATIYDPAPDFRFVNDTGNYVLFTTSMNAETGDLRFTFWGTSDGRKGYYSAPVVHSWTGAGEAQTRYTTDLAPSVRRCQSAYPGANASFTYTVERPGGELEQTVYESHYRALPAICLEGIEEGQLDENGNPLIPNEDGVVTGDAAIESPPEDTALDEPLPLEVVD